MEVSRDRVQAARDQLRQLVESCQSASLATVTPEGKPLASFSPVAWGDDNSLYLFVSELSEHTRNLQRDQRASLMLIEDESASRQIFARNRLTIQARIQSIPRDSESWSEAAATYEKRFPAMFRQLVQLRDFHLFRAEPESARLVVGFGAAYQIQADDWDQLELLTGK